MFKKTNNLAHTVKLSSSSTHNFVIVPTWLRCASQYARFSLGLAESANIFITALPRLGFASAKAQKKHVHQLDNWVSEISNGKPSVYLAHGMAAPLAVHAHRSDCIDAAGIYMISPYLHARDLQKASFFPRLFSDGYGPKAYCLDEELQTKPRIALKAGIAASDAVTDMRRNDLYLSLKKRLNDCDVDVQVFGVCGHNMNVGTHSPFVFGRRNKRLATDIRSFASHVVKQYL